MGPIGVFDSGYGGLTVLKELIKGLPEYDYIYLGDNARAPYGNRSFRVIYEYTKQAVEYLFSQNADLVILACNTASAKALRTIQRYDLPLLGPSKRVLGVIRPSVEEIARYTKNKHVGILGTHGTVTSNSYGIEKMHDNIKVFQHACPMWVPLVENDEHLNQGSDYFIKKDIDLLLQKSPDIDSILLACTHYPLLAEKIKTILPSQVNLISQGHIIVDSLRDYLQRHPEMDINCSKTGKRRYLSTEDEEVFAERGQKFLGEKFVAEKVCISK
jgi:glutamate racemase